jgi:hypothetical protein
MTSTILDFIDTVVADQLESLTQRLPDLGQRVTTPPHNPLNAVEGLHFASLAVFETSGFDPILVFESNFDGSLADYLDHLLAVAAADVHAVFSCCRDYHVASPTDTSSIAAYLRAHVVRPAAYHVGNVGRSRVRVEQEAVTTLGTRIDAEAEAGRGPASAGAAFSLVRRAEGGRQFQWSTSRMSDRPRGSARGRGFA